MSYIDDLNNSEMVDQIIQHGLDKLESIQEGQEACDLHHELYNMDYFIIGYGNAEEFLGRNVFEAIGVIKEYEDFNFGQVTTDISDSEKVANTLAYIIGEECLYNCDTLQNRWNEKLDDDDLKAIKEELEEQMC